MDNWVKKSCQQICLYTIAIGRHYIVPSPTERAAYTNVYSPCKIVHGLIIVEVQKNLLTNYIR